MSTKEELSLPFEDKLLLSKMRIQQWYEHWNGKVYVSFSGGLDSTVLLHIVRSMYPDVQAMFLDTGLEYPEVRDHVKSFDNVVFCKPVKKFPTVVKEYGFPLVSKQVSQFISEYKSTKSEKLKDIRWNGYESGVGKIPDKWKFLIEADFDVTHKCCDYLKKLPAKKYEKETGNHPIIGTRSDESRLRNQRETCNVFDSKRPTSTPLRIWSNSDIWAYIHLNNLKYPDLYDRGWERTGCMFCGFGAHMEEEGRGRFELMAESHPKIHKYCMEDLGMKAPLEAIGVRTGVKKEAN